MKPHLEDRPSLHVLLAEDDECVAGVICAGLRSRGHEVTCVTTGKEALAGRDQVGRL